MGRSRKTAAQEGETQGTDDQADAEACVLSE